MKNARCLTTANLARNYTPSKKVFARTEIIKRGLQNVKPPKSTILTRIIRAMGIK